MDSTDDQAFGASGQERRQLFRIDDTAIFEVVEVGADDIASYPADKCFMESPAFRVMRELQAIDNENSHSLRVIHDKYPELGLYLQGVNKKIDVIANAVASTLLSEDQVLQSIDLSEGGMGFNHATRLVEGDNYAIKIWFQETLYGIAAYIKVIACHRSIDGGYHISCAFESLPDSDQKVIARHIMQVQARQQRAKRESE